MKNFENITIELTEGDITAQPDAEAIVNAANAELRIGGGVAGAIHRKGDPELTRLTRPLAPIKPGEAVITEAPGLPNEYVIHCLGPVYGRDEPSDQLLADCYQNAIHLAVVNSVNTIAFPAISTGAFGYPMRDAAIVAFNSIRELSSAIEKPLTVRFVLFGNETYELHREILNSL